jgi:hypothetical protein
MSFVLVLLIDVTGGDVDLYYYLCDKLKCQIWTALDEYTLSILLLGLRSSALF